MAGLPLLGGLTPRQFLARHWPKRALLVRGAFPDGREVNSLGLAELVRAGVIEYIEFPPQLVGKYQSFTQADLTALRDAGYRAPTTELAKGVAGYVEWLMANDAASPVT